jgi:hypothetical protein
MTRLNEVDLKVNIGHVVAILIVKYKSCADYLNKRPKLKKMT